MEAKKHTTESSIRYRGWGVALAAFVGVMVSFAAIMPNTFRLFLEPLSKAFGWRREAISSAFGIAAITLAVFSPGIGMLPIARYFGRKHFAALYGLTWTAYAVGGATGRGWSLL